MDAEERVWARVVVVSLLLVVAGTIWLLPRLLPTPPQYLEVHVLDVGQGDAILLESPSGQQMLIDGGRNNQVLRSLAAELAFFDRTLDFVVATHPDADHIGGLVDVLQRYTVETVLVTDNQSDTTAHAAFTAAIAAENAERLVPRRGQTIDLGAGVLVTVLWPETNAARLESNAASVVLHVHYGETAFLLTGDSPKRIEEYLVLTYGEYLASDVLKVGHHGSRTSTAELFLAEVRPQYAVISAGADNRYGHPHVEVTDALFNAGVTTFTTAEQGTVSFISDGMTVTPY